MLLPQRFALRCVVEFNVDRMIFRFLVTGGDDVVCSDFISAVETIHVWFTAFETVFSVLGLTVGHSLMMCGRCAPPQCFDHF